MSNESDEGMVSSEVSTLTLLDYCILQAEEQGRQDILDLLLSKDFTIIRSTGARQDRASYLSDMPTNANRGRTGDAPEIHLCPECAVVISVVHVSQKPDGSPDVGHFWNTRVFVREDGQWRCISWQVTRKPEP